MRKKLTARLIETVKPPIIRRVDIRDELLAGFGVRVSTTGRMTWFVKGRVGRRQVRHTLGTFPKIGLAEAREAARRILSDMQLGAYAAKPDKRFAPHAHRPTLGEIVPEFIEKYAKPKNRDWRGTESVLQRFAPIYNKELRDVRRADVVRVLDAIIADGAPHRANRALAALKKLYAWALDRAMVDVHPLLGLKPPTPERSRDRILSDTEVAAFWQAAFTLGPVFGPMYRMLLLTAQRRGEVATMRWSNIDVERHVWTIPAAIAKNGRAHEVPLSSHVEELLAELPRFVGSDFVFTTTGSTPVSGFGKSKDRLDAAMGVTNWRIHDLRRTAASGMARLGVAPHVVERILNHSAGTISGVAAVYNRHGYSDEKREALQRWSDSLESGCAGTLTRA